MAARLDLYAGTDTDHTAGFVSANDDDEERLAALLADLAGRSALAADTHGSGHIDTAAVTTLAQELSELAGEVDGDLECSWIGALHAAVARVAAEGAPLAWRMRYDRGGSVDDGPDEFPTAWSGSPT